MLRKLALIMLAVAAKAVIGQVSELGFTGGVAYYIGDINPYKHYPAHTHLAGGIFYRYNFSQHYALRIQGLYAKFEAYDSDSADPLQNLRNLGFRNTIFEASALLEINFLKFRGITKDSHSWTPYVFVGLAYFHMNPQGKLDDTWYDLQPYGTEGQTMSTGGGPYKLDNMALPFGVGFKFALTDKMDFGIEWGLRKAGTDYIDDVGGRYVDNDLLAFETGPITAALADPSILRETGENTDRARGDAMTTDWYQYTGISFSWLLTRFTECDAIWDKMKRR
jgi:hypothetical protein